jgi:fibro-slime domain-containing protein
VVVYDSLKFTHVGNGVYEYLNFAFFPLTNRGFGDEGMTIPPEMGKLNNGGNYSFSMELHQKFTYQKGLMFNFLGDDDAWAFINDTLRMDLGGIHGATASYVKLDSLGGMQEGKGYNFDLFYAERHVVGSDIVISTNLLTPPPTTSISQQPSLPSLSRNNIIGKNTRVRIFSLKGEKIAEMFFREYLQKQNSMRKVRPGVYAVVADNGRLTTSKIVKLNSDGLSK